MVAKQPTGDSLLENLPVPSDKLIGFFRTFLRDFIDRDIVPKEKQEHNYKELKQALQLSLSSWNAIPPPIKELQSFDEHPSIYLLNLGSSIIALEGASVFHSRNKFDYSDGGVQVRLHNKAPEYSNWINNFIQQYTKGVSEYKIRKNLEDAFGGAESEYNNIGYF